MRLVRYSNMHDLAMRTLLYLVAFLTIVPAAAAQNIGPASPENDRGWFTIGPGTGYASDLSKVATVNVGSKRVFQLGYHAGSDDLTWVRSVNVGLGHSWVNRWTRLAGSVGPALSWSGGHNEFTTIGVVADAQIIFTPVPEIGVGATLWGNLNREQSIGALGFVLVFEGNK